MEIGRREQRTEPAFLERNCSALASLGRRADEANRVERRTSLLVFRVERYDRIRGHTVRGDGLRRHAPDKEHSETLTSV